MRRNSPRVNQPRRLTSASSPTGAAVAGSSSTSSRWSSASTLRYGTRPSGTRPPSRARQAPEGPSHPVGRHRLLGEHRAEGYQSVVVHVATAPGEDAGIVRTLHARADVWHARESSTGDTAFIDTEEAATYICATRLPKGIEPRGTDDATSDALAFSVGEGGSSGRDRTALGKLDRRGPGGGAHQDRVRYGAHRRARRERQGGADRDAALGRGHQQEGRDPRSAGGARLLRRPDERRDGAGHLHEAARRGQGELRRVRLRHEPHRARDADRDGTQTRLSWALRAREQRETQLRGLLPDHAGWAATGRRLDSGGLRGRGQADAEAPDRGARRR